MLTGDILFVNQVFFLTTISENIWLITVQYVKDQTSQTLLVAILKVKAIYSVRGFIIRCILIENEFEPLHDDLLQNDINLNMPAANEHVPQIEHQIHVIKEHIRATRHSLLFKTMPLLMLVKMVYTCTKLINAFPPKGGMSNILSPRTIIMGTQLKYKNDCRLPFSAYVQAHEEPVPTNTQEAWTMGAISLGPTGNIQGTFKFLNLQMGKKSNHHKWMGLSMPQEVLDHVNQLGKANGIHEQLTFYDWNGNLIKAIDMPTPQPEITGVPASCDVAWLSTIHGIEDLEARTTKDSTP